MNRGLETPRKWRLFEHFLTIFWGFAVRSVLPRSELAYSDLP